MSTERMTNFIADAVRPMIEREKSMAMAKGAREALVDLAESLGLRFPTGAPASQIRSIILSSFGGRKKKSSVKAMAAFLAAGAVYCIDPTDPAIPAKARAVVRARRATWIALRRKGLSLNDIASISLRGATDHSTVSHGLKASQELLDDPTFIAACAAAEDMLKETT